MELESLHIRKCERYEKENGYKGEVTFKGPLGKIQINLGETLTAGVLAVVANEVVASSKLVAEELTASIIEQVATPAIEEQHHD